MRNNNLKYLFLLSAMLIASLSSCKVDIDSQLRSKGEGQIMLSLGYNPDATVVTKSGDDPTFKVTVADYTSNVIIRTIQDHHELANSPIVVKAGKYILTASNGVDNQAAFESPFYSGKDTIEIAAGETVSSSIVCTLSNVEVSVSFNESITNNFTSYDVKVSNGTDSLLFDAQHRSQSGYFHNSGSLEWTIRLINNDGSYYVISNVINNVKPRQHYTLNFDISSSGNTNQGGSTLRVSLDNSMNVKEYSVDISLNKKALPTIAEASGVDISKEIRAPQGAGVVGQFDVTAAAGFSRVTISHNNADMSALGVPTSFSPITADAGTIAALATAGLSWTSVAQGGTAFSLDMRSMFSTKLSLGSYTFTISILDSQQQYVTSNVTVKVIPDVEVSTVRIDPWAKFAYVYAQYNTENEPAGMGFQYKASSSSTWIDYAGTITKSGIQYSAKITGLASNTSYDFRAVSTKDVKDDNIMSATTELGNQLPNMYFDNWCQSGDVWYPNANIGDDFYWDTANPGSSAVSVYPTVPEDSFVHSGRAAKLQSKAVLGILAAGNIYTGYFKERYNTSQARVSFGRPYTSRPLSMHGYYNYKPVAINKTKDPYTSLSGQMDVCQIYVMLTDWSVPYIVSTGDKNFIDPDNDPAVVAYGQLTDNTDSGDSYKEFTINLVYKKSTKPTHVVVVAVASKYGDYYTGGVGSTLYVDDFSFNFE